MTLPAVLLDDHYLATRLLEDYFTAPHSDRRGPLFTGGRFERLGGGGDRVECRNVITAEDLAAVSLLNGNVSAPTALALLEPDRDVVGKLLADIPADVDLVDADDATLSGRSAANYLWEHLVDLPGTGPATASKILARKRPRLLPVMDSVVLRTLSHPGTGYWHDLRHHLRDDDKRLQRYLESTLRHVSLERVVSVVRAFDVLVRLTGKSYEPRGFLTVME